jgi:hypothetical protein
MIDFEVTPGSTNTPIVIGGTDTTTAAGSTSIAIGHGVTIGSSGYTYSTVLGQTGRSNAAGQTVLGAFAGSGVSVCSVANALVVTGASANVALPATVGGTHGLTYNQTTGQIGVTDYPYVNLTLLDFEATVGGVNAPIVIGGTDTTTAAGSTSIAIGHGVTIGSSSYTYSTVLGQTARSNAAGQTVIGAFAGSGVSACTVANALVVTGASANVALPATVGGTHGLTYNSTTGQIGVTDYPYVNLTLLDFEATVGGVNAPIVIGGTDTTTAAGATSIAIGHGATIGSSSYTNSVALGQSCRVNAAGQTVLGYASGSGVSACTVANALVVTGASANVALPATVGGTHGLTYNQTTGQIGVTDYPYVNLTLLDFENTVGGTDAPIRIGGTDTTTSAGATSIAIGHGVTIGSGTYTNSVALGQSCRVNAAGQTVLGYAAGTGVSQCTVANAIVVTGSSANVALPATTSATNALTYNSVTGQIGTTDLPNVNVTLLDCETTVGGTNLAIRIGGTDTTCTAGSTSMAIGHAATVGGAHTNAIAMGQAAQTNAASQIVFGANAGTNGCTTVGAIIIPNSVTGTQLPATTSPNFGLTYNSTTGQVGTGGLNKFVQRAYGTATGSTSVTASIPVDNTIPQSGEGTGIIAVNITPTVSTNRIRAYVSLNYSVQGAATAYGVMSLCSSTQADAFSVALLPNPATGYSSSYLAGEFVPNTTSAITVTMRVGMAGTGATSVTTTPALFGSLSQSVLILEEIVP